MVGILMLNPEYWKDIQASGLRGGLSLPSLLPRYGHLVLAAVAGMGIFLMCYGLYLGSGSRRLDSQGDEPTGVGDQVWGGLALGWHVTSNRGWTVALMVSTVWGSGRTHKRAEPGFSCVFRRTHFWITQSRVTKCGVDDSPYAGNGFGRYCECTGHRVSDGRVPRRGLPILVSESTLPRRN